MKTAEAKFDVTRVWPGAFLKERRTSTAGNPLEMLFVINGDRYAMDFRECGNRSDWYQYDTDQDAWYYGHWLNPVLRLMVAYVEGDIYVTTCATVDDYRRELEALDAFCKRLEYKHFGIDDHDGHHWQKLGV